MIKFTPRYKGDEIRTVLKISGKYIELDVDTIIKKLITESMPVFTTNGTISPNASSYDELISFFMTLRNHLTEIVGFLALGTNKKSIIEEMLSDHSEEQPSIINLLETGKIRDEEYA